MLIYKNKASNLKINISVSHRNNEDSFQITLKKFVNTLCLPSNNMKFGIENV
jgi:hypothetical protein